jgi:uncharacterized membrane protein YedE/YeeE
MIGIAGSALSVVVAVDRQTVMLRGFWTLVVAAGLVSIGAWILLVREVRSQRRRRGDAKGATAAPDEAAPDGDAGAAEAEPVGADQANPSTGPAENSPPESVGT